MYLLSLTMITSPNYNKFTICVHLLQFGQHNQKMILNANKMWRCMPIFRMSGKKIYNKQQCFETISKTTSLIEKVAEVTLGPYGRTVLIQNEMQSPRITKDGVTVVKHIEFQNRIEDAIAQLVKKSVDGTNKYAGDGTTTSTILIGEIMRISYRKIATGVNVRQLRKGFEIGRKLSIDFLESCARKITTRDELMNVAMISTNGKKHIASLVTDAVFTAKTIKTVKQPGGTHYFSQYHTGSSFPRGLDSKQVANTKSETLVYNYPLVVTSLLAIKNVKDIVQCLQLAKKARKQLIIFAPDFADAVKSTIIYNNKKKIIECAWVTFPGYGTQGQQMITKIAEMTQSFLYKQFQEEKIENVGWNHFGKAVKVSADMFQTKIQIDQKNKTEGRLKNAEAVIFVGGPNQTVLLQNYDHIIDALNSTKSAMKDGVIAGGGVTFWRLSELLQTYEGEGQAGVKVLAEALKQPRMKLMKHIDPSKKPLSGSNWEGYDLKKQCLVDMFEAGIIDSVNVAKSVLIDALSLCSVLVEVERAVIRNDKNISTISLKQLNKRFKI